MDCNFVQAFWKDLIKTIQQKCTHCDRLNLSQELILFGKTENVYTDKAIDSILLYAKYFVYKCKLQGRIPLIDQCMLELKRHITLIEKILAFRTEKLSSFKDKWKLYVDIFDEEII